MREKRWGEAEAFALRMVERHAKAGSATGRGRWTERGGDAVFASGAALRAGEAFRQARELDPQCAAGVDLKLADVAFVLGDLETERRLRESIYGALRASE